MNNLINPAGIWTRPARIPGIPEILGCKPDHGDPQLAWRILGLHPTDPNVPCLRPNAIEFVDWCNDMLAEIWTDQPMHGSVEHKRIIEANRRILSAIHTLAGIRRPGHPAWRPNQVVQIEAWRGMASLSLPGYMAFQSYDMPEGINTTTWSSHVYVPLPYAQFEQHYDNADVALLARDEVRNRRAWKPTTNMRTDAISRENEDLADNLACYGFRARPQFMFPEDKSDEQKEVLNSTFYAAPTPRNENSLWYSLAILVENNPTKAKQIKGTLAFWLREILTNTTHPRRRARFRMYCQLIAASAESVDEEDVVHWGPLDILRCMNKNNSDSGLPMEAGYYEMLHLVADFFGCEVITFIRPEEDDCGFGDHETVQDWANANPYRMKVYGAPPSQDDYKLPFKERRQILLVTDSTLRYFQPVINVDPELEIYLDALEVESGHFIDTTAFDPWDRFAPMPWWPGYMRNPVSSLVTGNWDVQNNRLAFTAAELANMTPTDITTGLMNARNPTMQALGPYWSLGDALHGLLGVRFRRWIEFYEGDGDTDMDGLLLPQPNMMAAWTRPGPAAGAPADPVLPRRPWGARNGLHHARFKSKGHFEGWKRVAELYHDQTPLGYHVDCGWLKVDATEDEDKIPFWHRQKGNKRRKK